MSVLEETLAAQLDTAGIPYLREYRAIPKRKLSWDFAIGSQDNILFLVEVQGGTWSRSKMGHNSGAGIKRDIEKLNLATEHGFKCLQFTSDMVKSKRALTTIKRLYKRMVTNDK